ncbi:class I SAM-dependent methyltransferase [Ensifer soli]|uniref:class I SAM-dependent methyltransferase n=1 Tax=Ciceribacter sp. sgz301302 TaxID=3342379 RepID=UPI0035B91F77
MFLLSRLMRAFVRKGHLTIIDAAGRRHVFSGEPGPRVTVRLHDPKLHWTLATDPEMAAGEAYMDGTITFEEGSGLKDMLELYGSNVTYLEAHPLQKAILWFRGLFKRRQQSNRKGEAEQHVAHHYDIGNDFYRLFLDRNMLYSCAYFREAGETLEEAQRNKLRLIAAKLDLKPGQRILDIGSGWGDMALYLASMENVEVVGVTLSREQQALSTERARQAGLADRVRFELKDYRDVEGPFDRIVSVGMFEHVGVGHYDEFFAKVKSLLPEDGLALLHSIGHMTPPTVASTWIHKYIFPGGYTPALSEVFPHVENNGLWVTDLEFLRLHYATTLAHWEARFRENRDTVVEMYDERFARMWEFYLLACEAMFRYGSQLVFHMQLARSRAAAPIVRDYVTDTQRLYLERERTLAPVPAPEPALAAMP